MRQGSRTREAPAGHLLFWAHVAIDAVSFDRHPPPTGPALIGSLASHHVAACHCRSLQLVRMTLHSADGRPRSQSQNTSVCIGGLTSHEPPSRASLCRSRPRWADLLAALGTPHDMYIITENTILYRQVRQPTSGQHTLSDPVNPTLVTSPLRQPIAKQTTQPSVIARADNRRSSPAYRVPAALPRRHLAAGESLVLWLWLIVPCHCAPPHSPQPCMRASPTSIWPTARSIRHQNCSGTRLRAGLLRKSTPDCPLGVKPPPGSRIPTGVRNQLCMCSASRSRDRSAITLAARSVSGPHNLWLALALRSQAPAQLYSQGSAHRARSAHQWRKSLLLSRVGP
jgi:hypothetical protein